MSKRKKDGARELLKRILEKEEVPLSEIQTYLQTEAPVGVDDLAAEMQTIDSMQRRLATLTALKTSYLDTINELQRRVSELVKENDALTWERDCILLDLREAQNRLDKAEK